MKNPLLYRSSQSAATSWRTIICTAFLLNGTLAAISRSQNYAFPWRQTNAPNAPTIQTIPTPAGFQRIDATRNTFADWLRSLPLKEENNRVLLYNNRLKLNQSAHYKVLAIDLGDKDLQQCADAVMRLRSEYLFGQKRFGDIAFNFTSGDRAAFDKWRGGYRPQVRGNKVTWQRTAQRDSSYKSFRAYLNTVFTYAGSHSLSRELHTVSEVKTLQIGEVFIQGGFPGHAVIVVDLALHPDTKQKIFLLAQSYMPAQEIHILKNPRDDGLSPWYAIQATDKLYTPEWTFEWKDLKRFEE